MDRMWFYTLCKVVLIVPVWLWFRFKGINAKYVPNKGPALLASNHVSFLDHYITPAVVKRQIKYLTKAEYFEKPVSRWLFTQWGQIPLERGKSDDKALKYAVKHLKNGGVLGIYPEGTRSLDGYIHEGKTGAARIAIQTGAPIIPVGVLGAFESMPKGQHYAKPYKITILFGKPIDVKRFKGMETDRELCRALTDETLFGIEKLTKPHHVIEPKLRKQMKKRTKNRPLKSFLNKSGD